MLRYGSPVSEEKAMVSIESLMNDILFLFGILIDLKNLDALFKLKLSLFYFRFECDS